MQKVLNLSPRLRQSSFTSTLQRKWSRNGHSWTVEFASTPSCAHSKNTIVAHHLDEPIDLPACYFISFLKRKHCFFDMLKILHGDQCKLTLKEFYIYLKSPDVQEKMIWNGRQVKQGKFFLVSVFITSCSLVLKYFNHFHCSFSMFYKLQPPHLKPKNHDNCVTILPVCV